MEYCEIKNPPEYTEKIERWTRESDADGDAMGKVIEHLANNDNYLMAGTNRMKETKAISLPAAGWSTVAPYTQMAAVAGITAENNPLLIKAIPDGATPAQVKAYNKAFGMIDEGITANGTITFKCYNKKPTIDLTVGLKGV